MRWRLTNHLYYLVIIRWVSFFALVLTFAGGLFFSQETRIAPVSWGLLGLHIFSNFIFQLFYKEIPSRWLTRTAFLLIETDILFLGFIIFQNGGAHNPFSSLFLVFAGLAAYILPLNFLLITLTTILLILAHIYSALPLNFLIQQPLNHFNQHLLGMWLANSMGVILVCLWIYYMKRLNEKMAIRHDSTQKILADIEKMESLGRIVAQASHQLNTPLGTLQLGLSELGDANISEADRLRWFQDMQQSINSISQIISQIQQKPIDEQDEGVPILLSQFITNWVNHWANPRKVQVTIDLKLSEQYLKATSAENLGNILSILLDNAFEACLAKKIKIEINAREENTFIHFSIQDNGAGMSEDTKNKAFDPLYTTKPDGTGLGLYLAKQLVIKMGGSIAIKSISGNGTIVLFSLDKNYL